MIISVYGMEALIFNHSVIREGLWLHRMIARCYMPLRAEGWCEAILVGGLTYIGRQVKLYRSLNEPI